VRKGGGKLTGVKSGLTKIVGERGGKYGIPVPMGIVEKKKKEILKVSHGVGNEKARSSVWRKEKQFGFTANKKAEWVDKHETQVGKRWLLWEYKSIKEDGGQ